MRSKAIILNATTILGDMIERQAENMTGAEYRTCLSQIDKLETLAEHIGEPAHD